MKKIKKENFRILFFSLLYKFFLDIIFCTWISRFYDYMGFSFSFSFPAYIISSSFCAISIVYLCKLTTRGKCSDLIIIFLVYMYVYPQCTLCAFSLNDLGFFTFFAFYFSLIFILNEKIHLKNYKISELNKINIWILAVVMLGVIVIVISGYYTGFRITFNLSDYYEYRMEAREYSMPAILSYLFEWAKTILPLGLLHALIKKKYLLVAFISLCQIFCFSFNGKKSVLFTFVLVFLLYFFYNNHIKRNISIVFLLLTIISLAEVWFRDGTSFVGSKFIRRMMLIPSYLGWAYYDFFSKNELDYLRSTVLRRIGMSSPYSERIPRIIGRVYFASDGSMNANTGLCGDAFSNFGWASLLIYPILIVLLFKFLSNCLESQDDRIKLLMCFLTAYMLLSGAYFKCLLTGGLFVIGVLFNQSSIDNQYGNKFINKNI